MAGYSKSGIKIDHSNRLGVGKCATSLPFHTALSLYTIYIKSYPTAHLQPASLWDPGNNTMDPHAKKWAGESVIHGPIPYLKSLISDL